LKLKICIKDNVAFTIYKYVLILKFTTIGYGYGFIISLKFKVYGFDMWPQEMI